MQNVRKIGLIVLIILAVILVLQNTGSVKTHVLFATIEMPQAVLLFVILALGFGAGLLANTWIALQRKKES